MENQVNIFFNTVKSRFPNLKFEVIHNSLSSGLVHFVLRDHEAKGFGGANNQMLAAQKAYSEFVERKSMHELNKMFKSFTTSNGFAAHVNQAEAIKSSRYEVIERDAFLLTWHGKRAPYWIGNAELATLLIPENFGILKLHKKNNLDLQIGIIAISQNIYTAVSCVRMTDNRFYIDTKTGDVLPDILNALVESISFNSHYILKGYCRNSVSTPKKPIDHLDYYLKPRKGLDWFFKGSDNVMELPLEEITTMDCCANDLLNITTDRFVYYSEAPGLQKYYCGKLLPVNKNKKRFESVFGKAFDINKQIHPLS